MAILTLIATIVIVTPIDEILLTATFGFVLFPENSIEWYIVVTFLAFISLILAVDWKKFAKIRRN